MEPNNIEHNEVSSEVKNVKETTNPSSNKLTMPMAIVIAGVLIALAVVLSGGGSGTGKIKNNGGKLTVKEPGEMRSLNPVTANEHIRGDLSKAKIAVIEFSDFQCPYCKQLHPTMMKMMDVYKGDVVWVYRHFPLESIHPAARPVAHASECVAELGGNDAFWKFTDGIFNFSGTGTAFDQNNLATIVTNSGVDITAFNTCQTSGKFDQKITDSVAEAGLAGAQGTPDLTVVNLKTGDAISVGADPSTLASVLAQMLNK